MDLQTQSTNGPYVVPLHDLRRADVSRVGAKAANLGELTHAGFPVPDGFAVTTQAFDRFIKVNALEVAQSPETVAKAELPADIQEALSAASIKLNGAPLAVRSSGVAEDLEGASFAGQYETFLDVRGYEALVDAVRQSWASAFSARVAAYKSNKGQVNDASMAVLVQILVNADVAGVAFTANPVNGHRDETVVSAVRGLGERLVSGAASPDEWIVRGDEATRKSAPEDAIDAVQAREIAKMARQAEAHFGSPQDVEWAIARGKLFMLQARPITTLREPEPEPVAIPIKPPPGFWEREINHYPKPLSPMVRSAVLQANIDGLKQAFEEASMLADGLDFREIGGWVYNRVVPLGGKDTPAPPAWLMPVLIRVVPQLRDRIKGMMQAVRTDRIGSYIERWYAEWKPAQVSYIATLQAIDLVQLSDPELEQHLDTAVNLLRQSYYIHAKVSSIDFVVAELVFTCRDLLGWQDRQTLDLLAGLSSITSEPARGLNELARMARERPAIYELLEHLDANAASRLAQIDLEFARAFDAYQRRFSIRPLSFDIADPTLAEQPELALALIRHQIGRGYNPEADSEILEKRRVATQAEARAVLANRPAGDRERFERALRRAERGYPIREEHEFYLTAAPAGLLRYAALEVGKRLAQRGQIANRDDVFFLELDEARSALQGDNNQRAVVSHRKGERAWTLEHPGPDWYGKNPGPPPSFASFPPEARLMMEALMWEIDSLFAAQQSRVKQAAGSSTMRGIAVSAGRYTGTVRVIHDESEFDKIQPGDVLVSPVTSPVWSVIFPSVGALITDMGGILSHPAIIAREYRVPAVVATGNATRLLKDGQTVTVDGDSGRVEFAS